MVSWIDIFSKIKPPPIPPTISTTKTSSSLTSSTSHVPKKSSSSTPKLADIIPLTPTDINHPTATPPVKEVQEEPITKWDLQKETIKTQVINKYINLKEKFQIASINEYQRIPENEPGATTVTTYYDPFGKELSPGRQPTYYTYDNKIVTGTELKKTLITNLSKTPDNILPILSQIRSLPEGSLLYKDESRYIVATPEMQSQLSFYKSKGYEPKSDVGFYKSPTSPLDVLYQIKGETSAKIAMGSLDVITYFNVPFNWLAQTITGEPYLERHTQSQAARVIEMLPSQGETISGSLSRQLTSPEAIFGVVLPVVTLGASTIFTMIAPRFAESVIVSRLSNLSSANKSVLGHSLSVGTVAKATIISPVIAYTGFQMYQHPEEIPTILGTITSYGATTYAAGIGGVALGKNLSYRPSMNWEGTAYESYVTDISRQGSVIQSQYKPYEFGSASTHYSTSIAPTYGLSMRINPLQKVPLSVMNIDKSGSGFGLSRPAYYKDIMEIYATTPLNISTKQGTLNLDVYSSEVYKGKHIASQTYGFNINKGVKDLPGDILFQRTGGIKYTEINPPDLIDVISTRQTIGGISSRLSGGSFEFSYGDTGWMSEKLFSYSPGGPKTIDFYESFVFSKTKYAGGGIPGKYGFISGPDYETTSSLVFTKTKYDFSFGAGRSIRIDKLVKDYYGGSTSGLDTTGVKGSSMVDELYLPGGSGTFGETSLWSKIDYQGSFPKITGIQKSSLSTLESYEYGIQGSSRWNTVFPIKTVGRISTLKTSSDMSSFLITDIRSLDSIVNTKSISRVDTRSAQITSSMSLSSSLSISALKTEQVTLTIPVSVPFIIHTPTFNITDIGYVPDYIPRYTPEPGYEIPIVPYLPFGGSFGAGGGAKGRRRRRKGARYRIHPVRLYDALYVNRVAI